jgi:hypothetical protein
MDLAESPKTEIECRRRALQCWDFATKVIDPRLKPVFAKHAEYFWKLAEELDARKSQTLALLG